VVGGGGKCCEAQPEVAEAVLLALRTLKLAIMLLCCRSNTFGVVAFEWTRQSKTQLVQGWVVFSYVAF
jgi:hypothetical protein